jgi:Ca-activated chloride channel family protein
VEEVSPVSFDLKQERRRASLAEVIGIDISGSMAAMAGAHTKLELANEAAARSAALLGPGDMLGVEHVDTAVKWSVPLQPVVDKLAIDKAIRAVGPGGGGIIVPITLEAGYKALAAATVNLKHMLLLADGSDAEDMGAPTRAMVSDALRKGITTSIVAIGDGGDVPELELHSRLGNGRFYLIEDAQRLPAVFTQETILAARSAIVEKAFTPTRGAPSPVLQNVAIDSAPALKGYVVTIPKSRASVLLRGPDGDPILATWSAGVGRSAAFTSDLKDRWGGAWTAWAPSARLIAQLARDVAAAPRRRSGSPRGQGDGREARGPSHRGASRSWRPAARAPRDDRGARRGPSREVELEPTSVGTYEASVPLDRAGAYVVVRSRRGHRASDRHQRRGPFGGRRAAPHGERPRPPREALCVHRRRDPHLARARVPRSSGGASRLRRHHGADRHVGCAAPPHSGRCAQAGNARGPGPRPRATRDAAA